MSGQAHTLDAARGSGLVVNYKQTTTWVNIGRSLPRLPAAKATVQASLAIGEAVCLVGCWGSGTIG